MNSERIINHEAHEGNEGKKIGKMFRGKMNLKINDKVKEETRNKPSITSW